MNRPRFFRGLRIAVSSAYVILAVLCIVLWVRSLFGRDYLGGYVAPANRYEIHSVNGMLILLQRQRMFLSLEFMSEYPQELFARPAARWWSGIAYYSDGIFTAIFLSYWLLTLLSIAAAVAPWLRYRFGVRVLLLVTTFVTMVLGGVIWIRR